MAYSYAKLACVLLAALAVAVPATDAAKMTCGPVITMLLKCTPYLKGGPNPTPDCCAGVKDLTAMSRTKADRQTVCRCLINAFPLIRGIGYTNVAALPSKCGASFPYAFGRDTDCSK